MATDPMIAALAGAQSPLFAVPQERLQQMANPFATGVRMHQRALEADPFMQWDPSKAGFDERFTGRPAPVPSPVYDNPEGYAEVPGQRGILKHLWPGEWIKQPGSHVPNTFGRDLRVD